MDVATITRGLNWVSVVVNNCSNAVEVASEEKLDGNDEIWRNKLNDHMAEYDTILSKTKELAARMDSQGARCLTSAEEVFNHRDGLMDKAFEELSKLTEELLKFEDGNDEIGSKAVLSLPRVVECFKELAKYCENVIDDEGLEAVEAAQEHGENGDMVQNVNSLKERLQADAAGLDDAISKAKGYFDTVHEHHEQSRHALAVAQERQSGIIYGIFGDGDIDRAAFDCYRNEKEWETKGNDAWNAWDRLRTVRLNFDPLLNCNLGELVTNLSNLAGGMRANYDKILEQREVDNACWLATRALQYHVATNTEHTSRDAALRHVLKLISTENPTIDGDSDVQLSKRQIKEMILNKLGPEKMTMLERRQSFVEV